MKVDGRQNGVAVTSIAAWDPEAVEHLQERLTALAARYGKPYRQIRVVLDHNDHHDQKHAFAATAHVEMGNRTLHARATGHHEYAVASELDQRLWALFEREHRRRWQARHHAGNHPLSQWKPKEHQ